MDVMVMASLSVRWRESVGQGARRSAEKQGFVPPGPAFTLRPGPASVRSFRRPLAICAGAAWHSVRHTDRSHGARVDSTVVRRLWSARS